ncbi:hypothetical protein BC937DRAFT_88385 [Endogone sp. FLAS-F59071]|nr:hypothetical protein BC937DRAFT_88385 [Endogone sp. FLAS-F59071]|eukprot:RUS18761.1 hypothetical protein BC937DRAFT_88385 [Endogone sp. FLAS-F59071]
MSTTAALNLSPDADLYALLKLGSKATGPEIKSAYRRLALQHHPDKQAPSLSSTEKEAATLAFQQIGFAYAVLGDENRRKRYDVTGSVEETDFLDTAGKDWSAYFKELWTGVVNAETIEEYSAKYRGSDEERRDLLSAYTHHNGSMDGIFSEVPCSTVDDEERFRVILTEAIKKKEVRSFRAFTVVDPAAQERRRREATREAREAEELKRELGLEGKLGKKGKGAADEDGDEALKALILQNQRKRGEVMDAVIENILEKERGRTKGKAKAKGKKKEKGVTVEEEEPTEEEFQALQMKLFSGKSNEDDDNNEEGEKEELESSKPIRTKRSAQVKIKKVEAKPTVKRGRTKKDAGEAEAEDILAGATKRKAAREQEGEGEAEVPAKRGRKKVKVESEKVEKAPAKRSTRVK